MTTHAFSGGIVHVVGDRGLRVFLEGTERLYFKTQNALMESPERDRIFPKLLIFNYAPICDGIVSAGVFA